MVTNNNSKEVSMAESAYTSIKEEILKNTFPSGEFISISELAANLEGMGRTPVREAVQRLHDERLLIVVPRKGIIIPEFDIKKMMDQLEVRYILERHATIKALKNIGEDDINELRAIVGELESTADKEAYQLARLNKNFHMRIAACTKNQELYQTLEKIYDHHIRVYTYFLANQTRFRSTQEEHKEILSAMTKKDEDALASAIDNHYENTRRELLEAIMT